MHVGGITVDLNWFVQLILTVFVIAVGFLYLVKNTASKYFEVDGSFERNHRNDGAMVEIPIGPKPCDHCGRPGTKACSRCKSARYCSSQCQTSHWKSGHKTTCKEAGKVNSAHAAENSLGSKNFSGIALVPQRGTSKIIEKPRDVLFPYHEFVELFNSEKTGFAPCGLINCGNSCFANVVLQCLVSTRPLVAYMFEKGHRRGCRKNDWCFLCEFETHVERTRRSTSPFSPIGILSRLPNIGANLGYGKQEDAHEFIRFAIDKMQSVCLDEFGGEKVVPSNSQETTLIQYIFGGHLQSQVICTICNKISSQFENMMDLSVEIHGDAASLEECLDQFTAKEWLHGENMYKCDRCNDYVKACKRLSIRQAPNILTVALKRFESGRYGKLDKRVSFPETLDLSPYMSEEGDGTDVYNLYAVVVHEDLLNASFFGHYICYTKDFFGNWYRIDDSKVFKVELEEVLSQEAYMLLYSRVHAQPSFMTTKELAVKEKPKAVELVVESYQKTSEESFSSMSSHPGSSSASLTSNSSSQSEESGYSKPSHIGTNSESVREQHYDDDDDDDVMINYDSNPSVSVEITDVNEILPNGLKHNTNMVEFEPSEEESVVIFDSEVAIKESADTDMVDVESSPSTADTKDCNETCLPSQASLDKTQRLKQESPVHCSDVRNGSEPKRAEIIFEEVRKSEVH